MSEQITLSSQKRTLFGKKIQKLRKEGIIPANIFGSKIESQAISLPLTDFKAAYKKAGETSLINLQVEGEEKGRPVLISNIQVDPITRAVLHIDFRQVDLKQKITATIPVELVGEAPAVDAGAIIVTLKDEIEVEALPTDFPEKIEVDITKLANVGDAITIGDLSFSDKVTPTLDKEEIIVQAQEATKEEVVEEAEVEPGEVEATEEKGEKTEEEGESKEEE